MSSNTTVPITNNNFALLSIPKWTTVQESIGSYPKEVWHIVGATLALSVAAGVLREYVKELGTKDQEGEGFRAAAAKYKDAINAITYPFVEHPFKIGALGAFYFWSRHK